MLSITLDWLALTFKGENREERNFLDSYASAPQVVDETPRNGYRSATRDGFGVVHMWNVDRDEMGHHVIFSGSALRNIFEFSQISQRGLVENAIKSGGRITRLDLAKDAQDVPINLWRIWKHIEAGNTEGTAQSHSVIVNQTGGITVYVGSRQSEKFIRIYDKANQIGDDTKEWKRFELETKGLVARALANLLVSDDNWAGAFDKMARDMVDIPSSRDYGKFFSPDAVLVGIPKIEKQTDTEHWIQTQVIPAIVKHYHENPDSEAVKLLNQLLKFEDDNRKRKTE